MLEKRDVAQRTARLDSQGWRRKESSAVRTVERPQTKVHHENRFKSHTSSHAGAGDFSDGVRLLLSHSSLANMGRQSAILRRNIADILQLQLRRLFHRQIRHASAHDVYPSWKPNILQHFHLVVHPHRRLKQSPRHRRRPTNRRPKTHSGQQFWPRAVC